MGLQILWGMSAASGSVETPLTKHNGITPRFLNRPPQKGSDSGPPSWIGNATVRAREARGQGDARSVAEVVLDVAPVGEDAVARVSAPGRGVLGAGPEPVREDVVVEVLWVDRPLMVLQVSAWRPVP
jgi:hypothetical protein